MSKMKLDLDTLVVDSFDTFTFGKERGTVAANSGGSGEPFRPYEEYSYPCSYVVVNGCNGTTIGWRTYPPQNSCYKACGGLYDVSE